MMNEQSLLKRLPVNVLVAQQISTVIVYQVGIENLEKLCNKTYILA
jgi:hypothetical protein